MGFNSGLKGLNPAVVWPLEEMCDSERKPGSKAVRSKSGCGNE